MHEREIEQCLETLRSTGRQVATIGLISVVALLGVEGYNSLTNGPSHAGDGQEVPAQTEKIIDN